MTGPVGSRSKRRGSRGRRLGPAWIGVVGLLASVSATSIVGCTRQDPSSAADREIRLTDGRGYHHSPVFSPDGGSIAFCSNPAGHRMTTAVQVVPAAGGKIRTVRVDSTAMQVIGWSADGRSLFVRFEKDQGLRRLLLSGEFVKTYARPSMAYFLDVSADGGKFLYRVFNGDNWDLGWSPSDSTQALHLLAETATWEGSGCFGPGPGEVTAVGQSVYGSAVSGFFVWSPKTRQYRPIPVAKARNRNPRWSPDRRYLAYSSDQAGNPDLWILDMQTGRSFQVTSGPEEDFRPRWSPDGRWLTFMRESWTSHIFLRSLESGAVRRLTRGDDRDYDPVVSPGGDWVVWVRRKSAEARPGAARYRLCVAPVGEGEVRELNLGDLSPSARAGVAWSPDGEQIAFAADNGSGNVDVYRVSRDGTGVSRVTVRPGVDIIPAWSPDGKTIAFTRAAGGETQVWVIPATGGLARQVTFGKGVNQVPVWAPDSDRLAYVSFREDGRYEIRVVSVRNPKREGPRVLLRGKKIDFPLVWSEDGRRIVIWREWEGKASLWAVNVDGSGETLLGEEPWDSFLKTHFIRLNAAGGTLQDRIYPGRVHAYQDGENRSDVYVVRVDALLHDDALAGVLSAWK